MSERRFPGEKVALRPRAGMSGRDHGFLGVIVQREGESPHRYRCPRCADTDCREWTTLEVLDDRGRRTGEFVHHVSECEMSDRPRRK